jgi:hypothetical protein
VLDTNILLSSLPMVTSLVESLRWPVVVPLQSTVELDGFASNANPLGDAAKEAVAFVVGEPCALPGVPGQDSGPTPGKGWRFVAHLRVMETLLRRTTLTGQN